MSDVLLCAHNFYRNSPHGARGHAGGSRWHERNYHRQHRQLRNGGGSLPGVFLPARQSDLPNVGWNRRVRGAGLTVGITLTGTTIEAMHSEMICPVAYGLNVCAKYVEA